jgi:hypothetical protein
MSVGVRSADATPKIKISIAMTTNVYGRRSASLTIPTTVASTRLVLKSDSRGELAG